MKNIALVAAGALALSACNAPSPETVAKAQSTLVKVVDGVQSAALTACAFVPTAVTISNIVSAGSAEAPGAIATAICSAVAASPKLGAMDVKPVITVNGKEIEISGHDFSYSHVPNPAKAGK